MEDDIFIDQEQEDALLQQLNQEFTDDCNERLERLSSCLERLEKEPETIAEIAMLAHSIKGMAGAFGYPVISVIAHRLEDYLTQSKTFTSQDIQNIYVFVDHMQQQLRNKEQPDANAIASLAKSLPLHSSIAAPPSKKGTLEALVIMPNRVQQHVIKQELASYGFRSSTVDTSFEAIEMAVHMQPDLVLVSAITDELEGIELANILRVAKATKDIPIIIVTSLSGDAVPKNLPDKTLIAYKGAAFSTDLSRCLSELEMVV